MEDSRGAAPNRDRHRCQAGFMIETIKLWTNLFKPMQRERLLNRFFALVEDIQQEADSSEDLKFLATSLKATAEAFQALQQQQMMISSAWLRKCYEFQDFRKLRAALSFGDH